MSAFRHPFAAAPLLLIFITACSSLKPPPTPTLTPLASRGKAVFESYCARCHGTHGETVIVGPSLAGIATRAGRRVEGMEAEAYILNSIVEPDAYTVEGFQGALMPGDLENQIPPEDLEALVAYLLSLE